MCIDLAVQTSSIEERRSSEVSEPAYVRYSEHRVTIAHFLLPGATAIIL